MCEGKKNTENFKIKLLYLSKWKFQKICLNICLWVSGGWDKFYIYHFFLYFILFYFSFFFFLFSFSVLFFSFVWHNTRIWIWMDVCHVHSILGCLGAQFCKSRCPILQVLGAQFCRNSKSLYMAESGRGGGGGGPPPTP